MILGFIGTTELLLIGGLALLLVGGKKLPEMMRGLGKGVREFKDGMRDTSDIDQEEAHQDRKEMADGSTGIKDTGIDKSSKHS
ncbi:MAG: twin-arginine translocase TatA/TatE family subunit [Bacteroides sp.]|nr:twin-arginine translocase TatA/TatE family subunit [Bacteroides sp.]